MPIKKASEISFRSAPRCPRCDIGVLPYGDNEPFVVDEQGRVFCRRHGAELEPEYPALLEAYRQERMKARAAIRKPEQELRPLRPLIARIKERYHPEQIWLFGSRARGDARATSDWDLLVVVPDATDEDELDPVIAFRLQRGLGLHADVFPVRASDYRSSIDIPNTLCYAVAREGVLIDEC